MYYNVMYLDGTKNQEGLDNVNCFNYIDEVKTVFGSTVITRYNHPFEGITQSYIIPEKRVYKIVKVDGESRWKHDRNNCK